MFEFKSGFYVFYNFLYFCQNLLLDICFDRNIVVKCVVDKLIME